MNKEDLYLLFGALLARLLIVDHGANLKKVISYDFNLSYYLLNKLLCLRLDEHKWIDMLALLKMDSPDTYDQLLNDYKEDNFYKKRSNKRYNRSKKSSNKKRKSVSQKKSKIMVSKNTLSQYENIFDPEFFKDKGKEITLQDILSDKVLTECVNGD